jgi:uncharacterized protein (TIGR02466 family)
MASIQPLFSTPIYITELDRKFTTQELRFVEEMKTKCVVNAGNITSKDNYILNNPSLITFKKEMDLFIEDYFDKIICPADKITPYITQSWLNYTTKNQHHHRHTHPNSLVSGILYMSADIKYDKVKFYKDHEYGGVVLPTSKDYNHFNAASWWFAVETGQVMLFPSSLTHAVEVKQGDNTRISLSFNVFIKGTVGAEGRLNTLTL